MSDAFPYPERLRYAVGYGIARCDGVQSELRQAPALGILDLTEIDFIPGVVAQVRERQDGLRDMTSDEIAMARAVLHRMSTSARDALGGANTITVVMSRR